MRKIFVLLALLLFALLIAVEDSAAGNSKVAYTWTVTNLGQRFGAGGALFADGTAGGNAPFSAEDGQIIFHLHPVSWEESEIDGTIFVDICFETRPIKGTPVYPLEPFCLAEVGQGPLPVTGGPVIASTPVGDVLTRITPVN